MIITWLNKNKVLLIGLLAAVALPINDLLTQGQTSKKVLVFAGVTALLSFAARNLRGQWATIAGLIGTTVTYYLTMDNTGNIEWSKIIMFFIVQALAIVAPPAKNRDYEHADTIVEAKENGK